MLGDFVKLMFWRYGRKIMAYAPLSIIRSVSGLVAKFQMIFSKPRRIVTGIELNQCGLSIEETLERDIRKGLACQSSSWMKMCYLSRFNRGNIEKYIPVEGIEHLQKSLDRGKGAIMLNPHFGPFLLGPPALGHRGFKVNQVAMQVEPIHGPRRGLERLIYKAQFKAVEGQIPANFINAALGRMILREVLSALKKNEIVFFASTGRGGLSRHEVDFLGRRASFTLGPFKFAETSGAPAHPVFMMDGPSLSRMVILPAIDPENKISAEKKSEEYASILGKYAREYPDHFAHFLFDMHIKSGWDDHPFFDDYDIKKRKERES